MQPTGEKNLEAAESSAEQKLFHRAAHIRRKARQWLALILEGKEHLPLHIEHGDLRAEKFEQAAHSVFGAGMVLIVLGKLQFELQFNIIYVARLIECDLSF